MSYDWDLARFWSVFDVTRQRQGFGLRLSPAAFKELADSLAVGASRGWRPRSPPRVQPAASQIVLAVPGTRGAYMWVAGAGEEHLVVGVSAWIMVEIAAECGRRGHRSWDLCGADLPRVARFKSELGGTLEHYFQIDAPRGPIERAWELARAASAGCAARAPSARSRPRAARSRPTKRGPARRAGPRLRTARRPCARQR